MRFSRRSQSLLQALLLIFLFVAPCKVICAQSSAQTAGPISPAWSDAVARLASRIGNLVGSQRTVSIRVKNISSLTDGDAAEISLALNAELTRLGFHTQDASSADAQVAVTLSEGEEGYVWVAQVRREETEQTEMVAVPKTKTLTTAETKATVVLERKLVWEQPGQFLDFDVQLSPAGLSSTLVVLEPSQLVFYGSGDLKDWQASYTLNIPIPTPRPRDIFGRIDQQNGNAYTGPAGFVFHPNVRCTGGFANPQRVQCASWSDASVVTGARPHVPGHEQSDMVLLGDRCGNKSIVLVTGNGDFTEPDTIQGFLIGEPNGVAVASGASISFDGPVMALQTDGGESAARVVVHNLKSGNYEGYIVTPTCGP
jgi:hypothetical protein